jgi:4-diphosphocytidyl-2-C-methyl-D-erythritol kinase
MSLGPKSSAGFHVARAAENRMVDRLFAPAKINLHLRVGPRRQDGFHPLLTWMAAIRLFDTLTLTESPGSSRNEHGISMTCDDSSLPCDGRNLVYQAARQFREKWAADSGKVAGDVAIHLQKRIPAGGGLGGGSSDAACALVGLNRFWNAGRDLPWLSDLAAKLGSDVPFFLFGPSSICKGRGEAVRPIDVPTGEQWVTLVLPPMGMPTAEVYRRFDELGLGREQDVVQEPDWGEWASLDARSLLPRLVNDLETPAFSLRPDLGELRAAIERTISRPVRMSGSGSSLFTLFDEENEAIAAAEGITAAHGVRALSVPLAA